MQAASDMVITAAEVNIDLRTTTYPDPATNVALGQCRGHAARFTEKRQLDCHSRAGIDVHAALVAQGVLRRRYDGPRHVPVAGVYQTSTDLGSRTFLVEAPYHYTQLEEYLAVTPNANRRSLFEQAVEIVIDLHSKGLVLGSLTAKSFVVDPSGNLCLAQFEDMRVEDPNSPFRPIGKPILSVMAFMAPELLESLRSDGIAYLSKATDVYAVGCLGYVLSQLITGSGPFPKYTGSPTQAIGLCKLIAAVVDRHERPERPAMAIDLWSTLEACWARDPSSRPIASDILRRLMAMGR